jgi:hypothetical protein
VTALLLERAWVDGAFQDDVLVEIEDGRFTAVTPGAQSGERLPGLTIPGLANCHSHAFHRALRGGSTHLYVVAPIAIDPTPEMNSSHSVSWLSASSISVPRPTSKSQSRELCSSAMNPSAEVAV